MGLILVGLMGVGCLEEGGDSSVATTWGYEIVNQFPHDSKAFTQGLIVKKGNLYEGTGQYGESALRRVTLENGFVWQEKKLKSHFFGEGITMLNGKIYQLTWKSKMGFVYDAGSFDEVGSFRYETEGWGLTHDGKLLIMSDGSHRLFFLSPETFKIQRTIEVKEGGERIDRLNELEMVEGEVWANVYGEDKIVRIDPLTGKVKGWIDLLGLRQKLPRENREKADVLNGIAYDKETKRIFVTGKYWALLFEIKLEPKD